MLTKYKKYFAPELSIVENMLSSIGAMRVACSLVTASESMVMFSCFIDA